MTMIKKYLVILFAITLQGIGVAQNTGLFNEYLNISSNRLQGKLMGEVYYLSSVSNANHFLQQEWTDGIIMLKDGDVFDGVKMRYMAYGDELVAYNDNNHSLFIVDKNTVKQFILKTPLSSGGFNERKFVNLDSIDIFLNRTYFEELYSGAANLIVFHQIEEIKVSPYKDDSGKMYDTEFRLKAVYYILSDANGISKIQLKNRSLYSIYPENKTAIRKLLRKNKISIIDENSAIQAIGLLDNAGYLK